MTLPSKSPPTSLRMAVQRNEHIHIPVVSATPADLRGNRVRARPHAFVLIGSRRQKQPRDSLVRGLGRSAAATRSYVAVTTRGQEPNGRSRRARSRLPDWRRHHACRRVRILSTGSRCALRALSRFRTRRRPEPAVPQPTSIDEHAARDVDYLVARCSRYGVQVTGCTSDSHR